jgi:hypothetical protein
MKTNYFIVETVAGEFIITEKQLKKNIKTIRKYKIESIRKLDTYKKFLTQASGKSHIYS